MEMQEVLSLVEQFVNEHGKDEKIISEFKRELANIVKVDKGDGLRVEVYNLLKEGKRYSISEMSEILGRDNRVISSYLSYLRKDGLVKGSGKGIDILTDGMGRKFIVAD